MALTKARSAITRLTASGTGTALDVSASYAQTLYIRHSNGTGTVTTAAAITVQVKATGGTYTNLTTFTATNTAAQIDHFVCHIPDDAASVQVVYTAPVGPTGFSLDAEVGTITGL